MNITFRAVIVCCTLGITSLVYAGPREELMSRYATEARAAEPGFTGFSAARGETLHITRYAGGKADTPACTSCHGDNSRTAGRTRSGKTIEPMASSVSPTRYTDSAKVEKWFKRNCNEVLGRECTPHEKGDWLAYMKKQ